MQFEFHRLRRARRWSGMLAALCVAAGLVAGCGSSGNGKSGDGGAPAAKLSGPPIKIGFLHIDSGPSGNPQAAYGEQAAIARINRTGIAGRPVKVVECHGDGTPEKDIACANQFVEEHVVAVLDAFDNAAGATLPILHSRRIPLAGVVAFSPQTRVDAGSFYFGPPDAAIGLAPFQAFQQQGIKRAAFAMGDIAGVKTIVRTVLSPAAAQFGIRLTPVYYPAASPNFTTLATSMASTGADLAGTLGLPDEGQCTSFVRALRDVGYTKTVYAGFCTQFAHALGAKAANSEFLTSVWLPQMRQNAPAGVQHQLDEAEADLNAVADATKQGYYSYSAYATFRTFADIVGAIRGPITSASIMAALEHVRDLPSFIGPKITCNHKMWPGGNSTCSTDVIVGKTNADGTVDPVGSGFITVRAPASS